MSIKYLTKGTLSLPYFPLFFASDPDKVHGKVLIEIKTGKRPRLDWTKTAKDWKFPGPSKTTTAVRSSVSNDFGNFKTDKRLV